MKTKNKSNFMVQGAILGAASILVRLIGVIYRIPLNNLLGEKGIAYYGVAFNIYSILLLLSSYSLPLAVSKMVSARVTVKAYRKAGNIFLNALGFALCIGIVAFLITYILADVFAGIMKVPQSAIALRVLAFALIVLSILGVFRGFFQGLGNMVPTAISNIVEQIVNAIVSIVAASVLFNIGKTVSESKYNFSNIPESYGAAGGTVGTLAGAIFALLLLIFMVIRRRKIFGRYIASDRDYEPESTGSILKVLVMTIIPVILSTAIYNLGSIIDQGVFSNIMLSKGMDADLKDTLIGMYSGKYYLIVNIPIALASAFASSLIPSIVSSKVKRDYRAVKHKVRSAIKLTSIISIPCAVGIGVLAKPIIMLLFPTSSDPDKIALMLIVGCLSVVFYSISTITNSILQGIDKMRIPVFHSAASLIIHVIILAAMLYLTNLDIFCVVIADLIFSLIMCILNARSLKKYLRYKQEVARTFILPAICAVIMGIVTFLFNLLISNISGRRFDVVLSIIVAVVVYGISLLKLKVISEKDMLAMPKGTKLLKISKKLHLM